MQILWNALDPASKQLAMTEKLDQLPKSGTAYGALYKHTDSR